MHARLRGPSNLFNLHQIINTHVEPDFPCLADEIAEPLPDMNIKVTAFTVNEKYINNYNDELNCLFRQPKNPVPYCM